MSLAARGVLLALAALLGLALLPHGAHAALAPDGIEIDGDYVDAPLVRGEDWFPRFPPHQDPIAGDDDTLCGTSPAPKNDIYQYFLANNFDYLFVGMERLTNNGNTSFFLRFDITGDGPSLGDFIFVFCFGSGAIVTEAYVLEWDPVLLEWARDSTPPEVIFSVNATRVPAPFGTVDEHGRPSSVIDPGRLAESRIRLADIEGFDICNAANVTGVLESKSSCSLSSECKDTTGPFLFSFESLTAALTLEQVPGCEPAIIATAHATGPRLPLMYRWFLNGVDITDRDPSWATSDSILIPLTDECGPTEVRVIVSDGTCLVDQSGTLDVSKKPQAVISSLAVGSCDRTLLFDGSGSTGCAGASLEYRWDFNSDGIVDSTAATGSTTYPSCGDRLVTLVVVDGDCVSPPVFQQVHVNEPPVAGLTVVPGSCLSVTWGSNATDCDLTTPSATYVETLTQSLDYGDGSPPETGSSGSHDYAECGVYTLTLSVVDASGCRSVATRRVTFTGVLEVR